MTFEVRVGHLMGRTTDRNNFSAHQTPSMLPFIPPPNMRPHDASIPCMGEQQS